MKKKVLIIDTCILCVWLQIPNMDRIVKTGEEEITHADVEKKIEEETKNGVRIVLPLAAIIECGNHITQISGRDSYQYVNLFADFIEKALDGTEPWDIFSNQSVLFEPESLRKLVNDWRTFGPSGLSIGDTSIKQVAEFYESKGFAAEIYTADTGLKAHEPAPTPSLPRNRRRR